MKKRTIIIVSISLVLAILAISIIATFPSYLFEEKMNVPAANPNPNIQTDDVIPTPGEDEGVVGDEENGIEGVLPDLSITEDSATEIPSATFKTLATAKGVKFIAANNAFEKGSEFSAKKLGIFSKTYYRARHYVRDFAKYYSMYEITARNGGRDVQPVDSARIVIDIPKKYDINNIEAYYMLDNGVEKLSVSIDKEARTATVGFMQSGVYILIEKEKTPDDNTSSNDTSSNDTSSSDTSSNDTSGNDSSSNTSSTENEDASSNTSSDNGSSDITDSSEENNSSEDTDSDTSSDSSSTEPDPNKDTMSGWTPWY